MGWFFLADDFEEIEDARRQRLHKIVITSERERGRGIHRFAPFERLDPVGDVVVELTGRLHGHDEG